MLRKEPLKEILSSTRAIWDGPDTRPAVRSNFDKVLKCRTEALGSEVYASSTEHRVVHHTCKSRACTSCEHRATTLWQREMWASLPDVKFAGVVFTMPDVLWSIFQSNRHLLGDLASLGAAVVQQWAKEVYGARLMILVVPHNSAYDIRHYFTWSTVYSLPFGPNQHWLQTGWVSYLVGGWKANYLFQIRTGQPYNLNVGGDPANISGDNGSLASYSRPNINGNPLQGACGSVSVGSRGASGSCLFNPTVFSVPVANYGNMGKMILRQPNFNNLDFSVVKVTPIHESVSFEFRAEAFNVYNVVLPGAPGTTIGNSSAGLATSQGTTPRELQFGAKIIF